MFQESKLRSILKTTSWRILATVTTAILVLIFTGQLAIAAAVGGLEVILKFLLYFFHERLWDLIKFGRYFDRSLLPSDIKAAVRAEVCDRAFVLWFTGLPSSGKTTLADAVSSRLVVRGVNTCRLDGDVVREVFPQTGFSRAERNLHIRRMGFMASMLEKHGVSSVTSFVSPYSESRDEIRRFCKNFIEVYVSTPVEECERRDVKGLYQKARAGEIKNFTGIDDPYEPPTGAEIVIDTTGRELGACVREIEVYLEKKGLLLSKVEPLKKTELKDHGSSLAFREQQRIHSS